MAVNRYDDTRAWYAISTYSGYEDKVADSIKQRVDGIEMKGKIFDALVPKEKQIEIKNGKRKVVDRMIFQGYVLVEMKLSDETWYIVRNTPGVTGFIGTGTQPTPVSEKEIAKIKKHEVWQHFLIKKKIKRKVLAFAATLNAKRRQMKRRM